MGFFVTELLTTYSIKDSRLLLSSELVCLRLKLSKKTLTLPFVGKRSTSDVSVVFIKVLNGLNISILLGGFP